GGSGRIPRALARDLGRRVLLGTPVRRIRQVKGGVVVTSDRVVVRAKRVVVAIPPPLVRRIDFRPGLPAARRALLRRLPMGRLTKVALVYDTPFWRADGLTGQAISADTHVGATYDDSPEDGRTGIVFGFI